MKCSPLITIVTCTKDLVKYGQTELIERCISSVAKITTPYEHLIYDADSQDGTNELLASLSTRYGNIKVVSEPDDGIYYALNKGLRDAQGKYYYVLGCDDYIMNPAQFDCIVSSMERNSSEISFSKACLDGKEWRLKPWDFIYGGMGYCHQGIITRTSLLREVGGFDTKYKVCADYKATLLSLLKGVAELRNDKIPFASYCSTGFSAKNRELYLLENRQIYSEVLSVDYALSAQILDCKALLPVTKLIALLSGKSVLLRYAARKMIIEKVIWVFYHKIKTPDVSIRYIFYIPIYKHKRKAKAVTEKETAEMKKQEMYGSYDSELVGKKNSGKIRVLYDSAGFDSQRWGGVTSYLTSIFGALSEKVDIKLAVKETANQGLHLLYPNLRFIENPTITKHEYLPYCPGFIRRKIYRYTAKHHPQKLERIPSPLNSRFLSEIITSNDYDLIHLTGCHEYGDALSNDIKKPIIVTIHDLIPDLANTTEIIQKRREVLNRVDHIIAISQHTKSDLIKLYSVPEEKIIVIHHGCSPVSQEQIKVDGVDKFLLYIGLRVGWPKGDGSFSDYKNFDFMVDAIAPYLKRNPEMKLFCTGSGFTDHEIERFKHLGIEHQIVSKFVSSGEMEWLYANAQAFIYPSRYEGFGMPIVDAFARGCPVVCCNSSCFPEVAGGAALYFENNDAEGLVSCLTKLEDPIIRNEMIEKGLERAKLFSWQKAADETLAVYAKMTNK